MHIDLDARTAALSVGEFSAFTTGPRDAGETGAAGLWRAQLGTHWHNELRAQASAEHAAAALFEVPIAGKVFHRGWTVALTGRIDQLVRGDRALTLREIKTVTRALPADEAELRADYPDYFIQLATYAALARLGGLSGIDAQPAAFRPLLCFVEAQSGLAQTLALTPADDALFRAQLERIAEFLNLRLRARERLRTLRYRPAFATPRPGQETTQAELTALFERRPLVFFEAPTGFGKTGVLLEFALGQLRSGHFDRAIYLTSKSTGQIQVVRTLQIMSDVAHPAGAATSLPVAAWHIRNKSEHCVNTTFHCVRDACAFLHDLPARWAAAGLARFYLDERHARDLDTLRAAGRDARLCPYEITRAALPFNDVWIGDYNYVFAPRNRGLFLAQPGYAAARTLLIVDEAHNLPARVADAHSHAFDAIAADGVRLELHRVHAPAPLATAWDHWCHFLRHLRPTDTLSAAEEDDARHLIDGVAQQVRGAPLDLAALGPQAADALWALPSLLDELAASPLPRLWWCPRPGELALTCLDAATAIGATLREFGGVVLASATLTPTDGFAAACGLIAATGEVPPPPRSDAAPATEKLGDLTKRDTKKLFRQLTTAADLLRADEARDAASPALLRAHTPWRDAAYAIAVDARVDTSFQQRVLHATTTAATIAALHDAARGPVAVFFPSYAYAESIIRELSSVAPGLRASLQPRVRDLAEQAQWVEQALALADALFLVLGSSFAEGIDALGGRITHAMVVGPALPEVNAVQRARLAEAARAGLSRDEAFRRVYQLPGMTKVNQALGRLVRAPGQRARVILHCRRFLETSYAELLAPGYQGGAPLHDDAALDAWLEA
ncbi:MAG: PD-(D/E)XK nuclease family protein [Opitutaceae bacterium]|nr:PD-(D/E)XK nuclease family protein [Opitutaceae bacterium]